MRIKFDGRNLVGNILGGNTPSKKNFSSGSFGCKSYEFMNLGIKSLGRLGVALFLITLWGLGIAAVTSGNYCFADEAVVVNDDSKESVTKVSEEASNAALQGPEAAIAAATLDSWQQLLANPPKYIETSFVTTRYIHQGGRVFRSTGRTEISDTYGICWHMLTPKEKTFHVGGEQDEASLPGLDFLTALVNGDTQSLDAIFEASYQGTPQDGTVFFRPRGGDLAQVIFSVNAVFKNGLLASVMAVNKDGGSTRVEFKDYVLTPPADLTMETFCRE